MPVETKKIIRVYIILGVVIIILAAAVSVLVMYFTSKTAPQAEETQPTTTAPTETTAAPTEPPLPPSQFTVEDFTFDGEYLTCLTAETMVGIDVSHHQQEIDWAQVKEAGIQFVMVRLGYRALSESGNLYEDRYVRQNLQGARDAGLLVGAYFYSQATSTDEAVEEARYALSILDGFQLDLPLAYDWEEEKRNAGMDPRTVTACAMAFCRVVEQAGYQNMIYFNTHQAQELMQLLRLTEYPWWLAKYNTEGDFVCRFDMWQYTCTGTVPGIEGNVDINILILDED